MVSGITWIGTGSTAISVGSDFTASIVDLSTTAGLSALGLSAGFADKIVTVNASAVAGGLSIIGNDKDNYLIGGSGADYLFGGAGADSYTGGAGKDTFVYTAGNDVITDYVAGEDIISLGAAYTSAGLSGNDFVFNFGSGSSLTVKDVFGEALTITNASGSSSTVYALPAGLSYASDDKTALIANASFSGTAIDLGSFSTVTKVDASAVAGGISITGNALDNYLIGGSGADYLIGGAGADSYTGGAGKDTFVYTAGNDVITDYVAGEDIISFGSLSYTALSASGANAVFTFDAGSLVVNGAASAVMTLSDGSTVSVASGDTMPAGLSYANDNTALIANASFSGTAIDLGSFSSTVVTVDAKAVTNAVSIIGNSLNNSLVGSTNADTLFGGVGNDTLTGNTGKDTFVYDGVGADVITDYIAGTDVISLGAEYTSAGIVDGNYVFNFSGSSNTLTLGGISKIGTELSIINASGSSLTIDALPVGLSYSDDKKTVVADSLFSGTSIDLNDFDSKARAIDASALSAINLVGNTYVNTLIGGTGNDTFTGGKSYDLFVYSGGADVITDYEVGDKISLGSASIVDVEVSGGNLILELGDDKSLTLTGAANKKIKFQDSGSATHNNYFANHAIMNATKTGATLTSAATEFSAANIAKLITVDAAGVSTAINLTGNEKANRIIVGDKGASVNGGKGNDTLVGGAGVDTFIYNNFGGNDVIENYAAGEMISLVGAKVSDASIRSNGDVVFKVGTQRLTVKDAEDKEITFSESGTVKSFKNGVIYDEGKVTATLPKKYSSAAETFDATVTTIDASAVKKKTNLTATATTGATMLGGSYKDSLTGGDGADYINGNKNNDYISGGAGADSLYGGKGKDSLYGGAGEDSLYGQDGNDLLYGEADNDYLNGGKGRDTLYGGEGDDSLYGDAQNDKIYGGAGNDYIVGGKGNDSLWGDEGADTFVYTRGDGKDVIFGFANDDTLTFDGLEFTATLNSKGNEIYLKAGATKNAVTLKQFTATEFNINGDVYTISEGTLAKKNQQ